LAVYPPLSALIRIASMRVTNPDSTVSTQHFLQRFGERHHVSGVGETAR
jgi:hypothetical protein